MSSKSIRFSVHRVASCKMAWAAIAKSISLPRTRLRVLERLLARSASAGPLNLLELPIHLFDRSIRDLGDMIVKGSQRVPSEAA